MFVRSPKPWQAADEGYDTIQHLHCQGSEGGQWAVVVTLNVTMSGHQVEIPSGTHGQSAELQKESSQRLLHALRKASTAETALTGAISQLPRAEADS